MNSAGELWRWGIFLIVIGGEWAALALRCCQGYGCGAHCIAKPGYRCMRYKGHTFSRPNCAPRLRYSPLYFLVDSEGRILRSHASCNKDLCNYCPFTFEECPFPGRKGFRDLSCACTPDGMRNSLLQASKYGRLVDFGALCKFNRCSFREMNKAMERFPDWHISGNFRENGYVCAIEADNHTIEGIRYGCDYKFPDESFAHKYRSREVEFKSATTWKVECNDGNFCNQRKKFQDFSKSVHGGLILADKRKLMECPFTNKRRRPCIEAEELLQEKPWEAISAGNYFLLLASVFWCSLLLVFLC